MRGSDKQKGKRESCIKYAATRKLYDYLFLTRQTFSRPRRHILKFDARRQMVFFFSFFFWWKILKFAYCAWQSHPVSQQKYTSNAAAWSKWKRIQSPQSARVTLYLGHTNWETGDAKWHHYSSKCRPSFDFLRISVILFKMPLSEWNKSGSDLRFWGLCTIIIIIIYQHHTLWSGVIWGNSKVRSSRPQMMAGIKVTGLWMAAQSLREFTPVWYFLHLKKGSVWFQNATVLIRPLEIW